MKVFIDTSAFIAFFVADEQDHDDVLRRLAFYGKEKALLFTSDYILDELFTWFVSHQRQYLGVLARHLEQMEKDSEVRILSVDATIRKKAVDVLLKFSEHKISFTDATSYVLFKTFSFNEIFTLDTDFKKLRLPVSFPQLK